MISARSRSYAWFLAGVLALGCSACNGGNGGDAGCDDAGNSLATHADSGVCQIVVRCDNQPFCPAQYQPPPTRPTFLITQIDVRTPTSLAPTTAVGRLFNDNVAGGAAIWGIAVDRASGIVSTGAMALEGTAAQGAWIYRNRFHFLTDPAPVTDGGTDPNRWNRVMLPFTGTDVVTTATPVPILVIPIDNGIPGSYTELPLRNFRLVTARVDSQCIGTAKPSFTSCVGSYWNTTDPANGGAAYGSFEADFVATEAMNVPVPGLSSTLCNLLAGADCTQPQSTWRFQPDTAINGATQPNGWHLSANFAAVAIEIAP